MTAPGPQLPGLQWIQALGSGGFAEVHLYERAQPKLKVAVKLLRLDKVTDAERRQFTAEADAMAELADHPYIVSVLGADIAPDGRPYLMMSYYPGPDLLKQVGSRPLNVAAAIATGIKLAGAVETAHRAGIVHRDIKPANVLMTAYSEPGLSDFGIAGRTGAADEDDQVGVSIPWAAPEVIAGQSSGTVASDVYSLAATIWHLLGGHAPFSVPGDNSIRSITARTLHTQAPSIGRAEAPASLDRVLQQALAKQPEMRPHSAMQFARLLQGVEQEMRLARTPIVVPEAGDSEPAGRSPELGPPPTEEAPGSPTGRSRFAPPEPVALPFAGSVAERTPETDTATERRPARIHPSGGGSRLSPTPAATPQPMPTSHADRSAELGDAATERRPARVSPAQIDLTERRSAYTDPAHAQIAPEEETPTRPRIGLAVALVVVLLAVAGGLGLVFANSGGDKPAKAPPSAPGPTSISDVAGGDTGPVVPDITAKAKGPKATFSVTAPDAGESYQWMQIVDNQPTIVLSTGSTSKVAVPLDPGGQACVQLTVTLDGEAATGQKCVQ